MAWFIVEQIAFEETSDVYQLIGWNLLTGDKKEEYYEFTFRIIGEGEDDAIMFIGDVEHIDEVLQVGADGTIYYEDGIDMWFYPISFEGWIYDEDAPKK